MSARLCSRAPWTTSCCEPVRGRRGDGTGIDLRPDRYWPVIDSLTLVMPLHRAAVDDGAAVLAGAGADVDDPVALADRLLVVLDDDHRVAEVAQPGERVDEPAVVALVQPDRRLVEHVQRADEPEPIWLARRIRCASPPASVPAERDSVR